MAKLRSITDFCRGRHVLISTEDSWSRYNSVLGSQHIAFVASNCQLAAKLKSMTADSQPQAETFSSNLKDKAKPSYLSEVVVCNEGTGGRLARSGMCER